MEPRLGSQIVTITAVTFLVHYTTTLGSSVPKKEIKVHTVQSMRCWAEDGMEPGLGPRVVTVVLYLDPRPQIYQGALLGKPTKVLKCKSYKTGLNYSMVKR